MVTYRDRWNGCARGYHSFRTFATDGKLRHRCLQPFHLRFTAAERGRRSHSAFSYRFFDVRPLVFSSGLSEDGWSAADVGPQAWSDTNRQYGDGQRSARIRR